MKNEQSAASSILMVRPAHFGYNPETAENNMFQSSETEDSKALISRKAVQEFDALVDEIRKHHIDVLVVEDAPDPFTPDAVFPNNWISFHEDGSIITYPMFSELRRGERREAIIDAVGQKFKISKRYSMEHYEDDGIFLEGTGSLVLDRINRLAYVCLSERSDISLIDKFCLLKDYKAVTFRALMDNVDIYHTNVLMALGHSFVVICMDSLVNEEDKEKLLRMFNKTNKEVIEISKKQMLSFAGNMLEVKNREGDYILLMSDQAYKSLNKQQIARLKSHAKIVSSPIETIEYHGGGSVRCMLAEVFLTPK